MNYGIKTATDLDKESRKRIEEGLREYNREVCRGFSEAGKNVRPLDVYLYDDSENLAGGITADLVWDWLDVLCTWVREDMRGKGLGSKMLKRLLDEASDYRCRGAFVVTYSFQALDFYKRFGFSVVGEMKNFPPGETKYWLRKDF
jgi:GNAT superfamily N-acetyltransferase